MSLTCELSGESLASLPPDAVVVVTPSGHVCQRQLLASKLVDTAGTDPFYGSSSDDNAAPPPLALDDCIVLKSINSGSSSSDGRGGNSKSPRVMPPRSSHLGTTLATLQDEYQSLVLELYDTRKLLEETRQELSVALYQNDAAVRVIGRLSQERDQARKQQQQQPAVSGVRKNPPPEATAAPPTKKQKPNDDDDDDDASGKIPADHAQNLLDTWDSLHRSRKAQVKAAGQRAPKTIESMAVQKLLDAPRKVKGGSNAMAVAEGDSKTVVVTASTKGKKHFLVVSQTTLGDDKDADVVSVLTPDHAALSVDVLQNNNDGDVLVAAGLDNGSVQVWSVNANGDAGEAVTGAPATTKSPVVHVAWHPNHRYLVAVHDTSSVSLFDYSSNNASLETVATLDLPSDAPATTTCATLHPDGLLCACGTSSGAILVWDFKSQALGVTLTPQSDDAVQALALSPNGYQIVVAHASGQVRLWNLIKQQAVDLLNDNHHLKSVDAVAVDPSGKYAVLGGPGGALIVPTKTKNAKNTITTKLKASLASHVRWIGPHTILVASREKPGVAVFGPEPEKE